MKKFNINKKYGDNILFNDPIRDEQLAEYCRKELYGGYSPEEFATQVNQFSPFEKCSVAWPEKTIAFRCYTCSYHPNVAICNECFDFSKHENHNYIHYESFGGVCDCGDEEALKTEGFCDKHGLRDALNPPSALVEKANEVIRVVIVKCAHPCSQEKENIFLNVLKKWAKMGYFMQKIIAKNLLDESFFEEYNSNLRFKVDILDENDKTMKFLKDANQKPPPIKFVGLLTSKCFLDWFFIHFMSCPSDENFCDFILALLSITELKNSLTNQFVRSYPYLIRQYLKDKRNYSKRMGKISVQLLSSHASVEYLLNNHSFMEAVIYLISSLLDKFKIVPLPSPVVQDFLHFISHKAALKYFLSSDYCINNWLNNSLKLQGRFTFERELKGHVEYDSLLSFEYFKIETEICTLPVWTMLPNSDNSIQKFLDESIMVLLSWRRNQTKFDKNEMTFNLPLHRIVSILWSHQLRHGYFLEDEPSIEELDLRNMLDHPLRTIAAVSEILCKFWVRNGKIMAEQAILYKKTLFSSTTYDLDLFLVQFLSSRLNPDYIMEVFLEKFSVLQNLEKTNWFKSLSTQNMLQEALFFLASVVSCRKLSGETEEGLMEEELITLLSTSECTHQEILKLFPKRGPLINAQWEIAADPILSKIANYKRPEIDGENDSIPGHYSLKYEVLLACYDPVLVRMRAISIENYGGSLASYYERITRNNSETNRNLWPPFRIPKKLIHPRLKECTNFLHSQLMQAFIFVLLHKCLQNEQAEGVLQITIHLLHMTLVFPYIEPTNFFMASTVGNIYETCLVPMDREHGVLAPYGLNNLFVETWHISPSETSIFPPGSESSSASSAPPPSSSYFEQRTTSDLTILSMLLQLYQRYSKKVYRPPNDCVKKNENMRVGGGEYYIEEVLEKLVSGSEEVRRVVEELTEEDDSDAKKAALDRKKMLVKNKIKKIMAKKREKSMKAFAEAGLDVDADLEEDEEGLVCCICNSSLTPSATDPPCFVALLTNTNIMGLRRTTRGSDNTYSDYSRTLKSHIKTLFPDMDPNLEWHWSGMIQTCGHMLHKSCHLSHVTKQKIKRESKVQTHLLEYWCPLCRQLCNTILPSPADEALEMSDETTRDYEFLEDCFRLQTPLPEYSAELAEIALFYNAILKVDKPIDKELTKLFRNNVEIELMIKRFITEQNNNPNPEVSYQAKTTRKTHLGALRAVCSNYLKRGDYNWPFPELLEPFKTDISNREKMYDIALLDLRQCFTELTLYHFNPTIGSIRTIVRFFINCFVVNMIAWIVLCTDEKTIIKWIEHANLSTCQLGKLLEKAVNIVKFYQHERKKYHVRRMSEKTMRIFSDFLRFCVLVYNSVVNPSEATIENIDTMEMGDLLSILLGDQYDNALYSIRCYEWNDRLSEFYLGKYISSVRFLLSLNKELKMIKKLTMDLWETPKFITLPSSFRDLRAKYINPERRDNMDVFLCIICGQRGTFKVEKVPEKRRVKTYMRRKCGLKIWMHAGVCGNGTCIFMGNVDNRTIICQDAKFITWESLYVNRYGEDDPKFKHGRELMLNENRMHFLRSLWVLNQIDKLYMRKVYILR